ncbi:Tetratricopeptide-like helical domain protein [Rutstroemia sp. NJR-2017a BVV2]|nr:Tetratricopeptide-like helical domain protein [Rutstroemia sp. NJR-2017a BVV2]
MLPASRNQRLLGLQQVPSDNTVDNTTIDIIAIHGLDTGSPRTWEYRKNGGSAVNWISDGEMLPALVPEARIYTYEWNANCFQDAPVQTMFGHADKFLACVAGEQASQSRPIIFVASCFGGLILAEAMCRAAQEGSPYRHILLSTVGAVFLATPFGGSDAASQAQWLVTVKGIMGEQSSDQLVRDLKEKHNFVRHRVQKFAEIAHADSVRLPVRCFYETKKTKLLRKLLSRNFAAKLSSSSTNKISFGVIIASVDRKQLVTESSACLHGFPRQGLDAAHSEMNKFGGPEDLNFKLVGGSIKNLVQNASGVLKHRQTDAQLTLSVGATSYGNVHWRVPRTTNTIFTGRGELLYRIQKAIHSDSSSSPDKQKRFVITGLGGQGKSEICLQVASQMREEFWGVFWVDVDKVSTAESDFIAIAKLLGHSVGGIPDALHILASTEQTWLLILDNADDPNFDYQMYFPSGTHGAVLMTSRVSQCKMYSPEQFEALEGLGNEDSKELLLKAANIPKESWRSYNDQAETVVQLLASHTLALIQAGAYIAKGHCQLYEYPEVYQQQRKRLMQFRPEQARSRYCDVYATFEASAEVLEQSGSEAARDALDLLAILSMLDSAVLPLQSFQIAWASSRKFLHLSHEETNKTDRLYRSHVLRLPGFLVAEDNEWDAFRLIEASSQLVSLSLVTRNDIDGSEGLSMHPLAHAWAKDRQCPKQQRVAWIATGCFLTLSRRNYKTRHTHERYFLPHIQSYLDIKIRSVVLSEDQSIVIPILLQCGWILLHMRQDIRLSYFLEEMFTILGKNPEEPSKESLPLYDLQAGSLYNLGKSDIVLLQKMVKIRETTLAENHPNLLDSQHELALAYEKNGQIKEAIALLEHVVKIKENLAEDHRERLVSQHGLACAYGSNGQIKEAIALLEHIVKIKENLAEDHQERLVSQYALAYMYEADGQIKEAVTLLEHVVRIQGLKYEIGHPDRVLSERLLASCLKQLRSENHS